MEGIRKRKKEGEKRSDVSCQELTTFKLRNTEVVDICKSANLTNCCYVELVGISGGLALWWNDKVEIEVISKSKNIFLVKCMLNSEKKYWWCLFMYADPVVENKVLIWEDLMRYAAHTSSTWCVIGHFNIIGSSSDRDGGDSVLVLMQRAAKIK